MPPETRPDSETKPEEHAAYRATFYGMRMPSDSAKIALRDPPGPFLVELFISNYGQSGARYRARILGTPRNIPGRSLPIKDAKTTAAAMFHKQVTPWEPVK